MNTRGPLDLEGAPLVLSAELGAELAALPASVRVDLAELERRSVSYERAAAALGTRLRYRSAWDGFVRWSSAHGLVALPADSDVVRLWLVSMEQNGRSLSTLAVGLAAVRKAHALAGHPVPESERIRTALRGIRRTLGPKARHAQAVSVAELRAIVGACPMTPMGARNRAMLLMLYLGAFRRSEVCGFDVGDLARNGDGFIATIRTSKTDQAARGQTVGLPLLVDTPDLCPVRALDQWLAVRAKVRGLAAEGPLFPVLAGGLRLGRRLDGRDVARLLQRLARKAGFDAARFRPHGFRAGLATEAGRRGASLKEIQDHLRHTGIGSTLRYLREGEQLGTQNPARRIT